MNKPESDDNNTRAHIVLTKGTMVFNYRIIEHIGSGGMGEVYLAVDSKLKRQVALKFLPESLINNKDIKERFHREAQAVAKLNHPNIVTIHEVSEFNGRPFFVMEHIKGKSLYHFTQEASLPIDSVIEYSIQICQGLGDAHRNRITHRDIKAANISIDSNNRIRLLDFGLAAIEGDTKITKTGSTLGTVAYMSPEQISGRDIDNRSDLFSLGVLLYELLAGRSPFKRENEGATLKAIIEDNPEPIARYKTDVPEKLQDIIYKLLEKDKELRYQSAEGVIADLKRLMYDSQQSSFPLRDESKKTKFTIPYLLSAIVVVAVGLWAIFFNEPKEIKVTEKPVLVVIPFENLGSDEEEFFSDGIRTEIGSKLSRIQGISVITRATNRYKDTILTFQQIGEETGANYILDGTIRWDKSGEVDLVRITPRLTKISDGYLMWSDNYTEDLVHIFDVQSDIAEKIVTALDLTLLKPDSKAPNYAPTTNMAAYNYYLRGLELSQDHFYMQDFRNAIDMFDSAIALDPNFALAYAQKSMNHSTFYFTYTTTDAGYHIEEAKKAAEKALELDPNLPTAQVAMGTYYNYIDRDYDKALASFSMAKSEMASNALLTEAIGIVKMRQGKFDEAIEKFEEAVRLDPLSGKRYFYLANAFTMTRQFESSDKYLKRALVLDPSNVDAAFFMIYNNMLQHGKVEYGDLTFNRIVKDASLISVSTYEMTSASSMGLWRLIIDRIDIQKAIDSLHIIKEDRSEHFKYISLGQLYDLSDRHDSALFYYEKSIQVLKEVISSGHEEFHAHAEIGLTYALMSKKDLAITHGKKAMEMMPIEECHW